VRKRYTPLQLLELDLLKFLIDECTGISVSIKLVQLGYDSISVIEQMKGASDKEIMERAVKENRIIVTNDKYFGRLAGFNKLPGMILLRLKDESIENKVKVVSSIVNSYANMVTGNIMVVSEKKIRVQKMRKSFKK
jgi:predicted nuclease of predicted toxin-antitoxin system